MATTVTAEDLRAFVGASPTNAFVLSAYDVAVELVSQAVGTASVPAAILDEVTLEVGASVFRRRAEPSQAGAVSLTPDGAVPVRQPKDPMSVARALLTSWVPGGFG